MKPLSEEARALLAAAFQESGPTAEDRARVLRRIEQAQREQARADERLAPGNGVLVTPLATHRLPGPVSRRRARARRSSPVRR
jgi:hypothetical protein